MREEVIAKILEEKIIAIVRGVGAEECMKVAQALYEGGIRLMEITFDQKNPASFQATAGAIRAIGEAYAGKMMVSWWSWRHLPVHSTSSLRMSMWT